MNVPGSVRQLLNTAIEVNYQLAPFTAFASKYEAAIQVNFVNETALANSYKERLFDYVELVYTKGTLFKLVDSFFGELNAGQLQRVETVAFKNALEKLFTQQNGEYVLSKEHFHCPLVSSSLAFVDREGLRDKLYEMIGKKGPRMVIIDGKPKSGLSFMRYYLSEVSSNTSFFDFVQVDVKRKVKDYSTDGLVRAVHLAQHISDSLKMNYSVNGFKITPFINALKAFLSEKKSICLFFFSPV